MRTETEIKEELKKLCKLKRIINHKTWGSKTPEDIVLDSYIDTLRYCLGTITSKELHSDVLGDETIEEAFENNESWKA
jgi:hypothetical protein